MPMEWNVGSSLSVVPSPTCFFPDNSGVKRDLVLGFDDPTQYRDNPTHPYFGALIGRYANRIGGGKFTLNNYVYHTPLNDGNDTLHGGDIGYDRRVWTVKQYTFSKLVLSLDDGDLVESFPGSLHVEVTYSLTDNNELLINYLATSPDGADTVINLSQHTYWNLHGFLNNTQDVLDHVLHIDADRYTPVDINLIPTGEIQPVRSAPWLDFRIPKPIGKDIPEKGYDNNWVLNQNFLDDPVVESTSHMTGIQLRVFTTQPGMQFYSGTYLDGTIPRKKSQIYPPSGNEFYQKLSAVVLEAQHFPDSLHWPQWPTTVLRKGEIYNHTTIYRLSAV